MKKAKAFLALMLSIIMIVSVIPASTNVKASYMPLEEIYGTVDLSALTTEQLQAVSVDTILANIKDDNGDPITVDGKAVAYTFNPLADYREYTILNDGESLNLVSYVDETGYEVSYINSIEFICGEKVDQLSTTNKRYIISIITPDYNYTEKDVYLDLAGKSVFELKSISLETLLEGITEYQGSTDYFFENNPDVKVLAYKLRPYESASSRYERTYKVESNYDKVDLVDDSYDANHIDSYMYLICSDSADEHNVGNLRLKVNILTRQRQFSYENIFYLEGVYSDSALKENVECLTKRCVPTTFRFNDQMKYVAGCYAEAYIEDDNYDQLYYKIGIDESYKDFYASNDYSCSFYYGSYSDTIPEYAEKLELNDRFITVKSGGGSKFSNVTGVTCVIKKGEVAINYIIDIYMFKPYMRISKYYPEGVNGENVAYASDNDEKYEHWDNDRLIWTSDIQTYYLYKEYSADDNYLLRFDAQYMGYDEFTPDDNGLKYIKKAVIGYYNSLEEATDAEDIKDELFSDTGYSLCLKDPVVITVFDINGGSFRNVLKVVETDTSYSSSYSDIEVDFSGVNGYGSYEIGPWADSYYSEGFQPVFFAGTDYAASGAAISVESGKNITPYFYSYWNASVYAGQNGKAGTKQESGVSEVKYDPDSPVLYTGISEDELNQKNYFISFESVQKGPKLFVNGISDEASYVQEGDKLIPVREVKFDDQNYHDIFFANVGDEDIEGLYVRLENANNVEIDGYWTIGDTKKLGSFAWKNPDDYYYKELANKGKIRLVKPVTADSGSVDGTLVIGYDGNGEKNEEIRIKLTGLAGEPAIVTEEVIDAVKYVPYSCVIQNNARSSSTENLSYEITAGELPEGFDLKPNGEIYGMPTKFNKVYNENDIILSSTEPKKENDEWVVTLDPESDDVIKLYDKEGKLITDEDGNYIVCDLENYEFYIVDKDGEYVDDSLYYDNDEGNYVLGFEGNKYTFEVTMTYKYYSPLSREDKVITDSKTYTIEIKDNTAENIEEVNKSEHGYEMLDYLDTELNLSGNGETLRSSGAFADFVRLFLDGKQLTKDTDYTAEEGSTKITIYNKTLEDAGLGEHTIAAEFRDNGSENAAAKASAQKFEIKKLAPTPTPSPEPSHNSGSSNGSGSGSSGNGDSSNNSGSSGNTGNVTTPTTTPKPTAAPTPTPKVTETKDEEGNVTKVTETTAADKSKVIETKVEKKNGNTRTTTEYIDANGKTTKVEEVKSYKNKYGTKVSVQKTEKADGSVSYKEVRNRKNGEVVTKTLKTDANGNTSITTELVKKNGKKINKSYTLTGKGEVELKSCKTEVTTVKVPATLNIDGKKYSVTSIAKNAFKGNTVLKEVVIGSKVKSIGAKAFYGCSSLATIKVNSKLLETVGSKAFYKIAAEPKFEIKATEKVYDQEKALIKKSKVAKATKWERK